MAKVPENVEWVAELVPALEAKVEQFIVDTDEVDDELIEVFVEELKRLTDELQGGVAQGDDEVVRMAAHSIKGMGGTIGLPEISVLGLEIETTAKENRLTDAEPMVSALAGWVAQIG
jgi:HPt (histidine-containing phosphotransfer) domain-containing protein